MVEWKVFSSISRFFRKFRPYQSNFIFSLNFIWHLTNYRALTNAPYWLLRQFSMMRPVSVVSAEVLQLHGSLHLGYMLLSLQGILEPRPHRLVQHSAALCLGNFSSAYYLGKFMMNSRWSLKLAGIFGVTVVLGCLNLIQIFRRNHKQQ